MKNYLFPRWFQIVGLLLFIPATVLAALIFFGILSLSGVAETVINDVAIIGMALGALFIVCSKEAHEDEMTSSIRLASLLNSLYIYVLLLVTSTLLINGLAFMNFAMVNLVLLPVIYVIIFRLEMLRYNKMSEDEE